MLACNVHDGSSPADRKASAHTCGGVHNTLLAYVRGHGAGCTVLGRLPRDWARGVAALLGRMGCGAGLDAIFIASKRARPDKLANHGVLARQFVDPILQHLFVRIRGGRKVWIPECLSIQVHGC